MSVIRFIARGCGSGEMAPAACLGEPFRPGDNAVGVAHKSPVVLPLPRFTRCKKREKNESENVIAFFIT